MSLQYGKHIFDNDSYLTQAEMEKYLSGDLSRAEQYVIEQKIAANQFNAEAMEGYEAMPGAIANTEKYKQEFMDNVSGTPSWLKAPVIVPSLAALVVFLISTLVVVNYLQRRLDIMSHQEDKKEQVIAPTPDEKEAEAAYLANFVEDQKEIVSANEIEEEKQISYEVALENQQEQKQAAKVEVAEPPAVKVEQNKFQGEIEAKKPSLMENKAPENKVRRSSSRSNVVLRYFNDLKTVDYSKLYSQEVAVPGFELGGIDAKYEYTPDADAWEKFGPSTRKIPYNTYLAKAMNKFSENQYKEALQDFRVILEQFPEDHNALFYGGLCYYNLSKPNKAIGFFSQIEKGYINTFYEEARWYKALSYEQTGAKADYKALLTEIADEGGFYSERAEEKLSAN